MAFKQQTLNCAQPLSFTHYAHTHARERTHGQLAAVSTSTAASLSATAGRWPPASASGPAPATCQPPTSCPTRPWIAQQPRGYCCLGPGSEGEHRVASERAQMPGCGRRVTTSRAPRTAAPIRSFCHTKRWSGLQLNSASSDAFAHGRACACVWMELVCAYVGCAAAVRSPPPVGLKQNRAMHMARAGRTALTASGRIHSACPAEESTC